MLPAGFLYAWDQATAGHLTELDSAETESPHVALWTAGKRAAVVQTYRRCILRELVESSPVTCLLQCLTLCSILGNQFRALYFASFH